MGEGWALAQGLVERDHARHGDGGWRLVGWSGNRRAPALTCGVHLGVTWRLLVQRWMRRLLRLQQFDGRDFQRIALDVSVDIYAQVIFLVRRFEGVRDLGIARSIELQELVVLG
jgi:hypothetical protein